LYEYLNYVLIDPNGDSLSRYKWIYIGFNLAESVTWFIIAIVLPFRFKIDRVLVLQVLALALFGLSDIFEVYGTTALLLLFKASLLIALLQGKSRLVLKQVIKNRL
jgi:hypothetical protein